MATLKLHKIPMQTTDTATAIAISSKGQLCAAWKGHNNRHITLIFNADQGAPEWLWDGRVVIPGAATDHAPAIVFMGERLFIAWTEADGTNNVSYTFSDDLGKSFGYKVKLNNTNSKTSPELTAGKSLFIGFTDQNNVMNVMSVG